MEAKQVKLLPPVTIKHAPRVMHMDGGWGHGPSTFEMSIIMQNRGWMGFQDAKSVLK